VIKKLIKKLKTKKCQNCIQFKITQQWVGAGYDWKCKLGPHPPADECENYKRKFLKFFRPK
jgi:hypothetical protein